MFIPSDCSDSAAVMEVIFPWTTVCVTKSVYVRSWLMSSANCSWLVPLVSCLRARCDASKRAKLARNGCNCVSKYSAPLLQLNRTGSSNNVRDSLTDDSDCSSTFTFNVNMHTTNNWLEPIWINQTNYKLKNSKKFTNRKCGDGRFWIWRFVC